MISSVTTISVSSSPVPFPSRPPPPPSSAWLRLASSPFAVVAPRPDTTVSENSYIFIQTAGLCARRFFCASVFVSARRYRIQSGSEFDGHLALRRQAAGAQMRVIEPGYPLAPNASDEVLNDVTVVSLATLPEEQFRGPFRRLRSFESG